MISDFYIRSLPLICLMALIPWTRLSILSCNQDRQFCLSQMIIFSLLFGGLLIFEFIMNKRMRLKIYSSYSFILNVFFVSTFSSFYNLLCSLNYLKDDPFYAKSVDFRSFMFEHKIRLVLSVITSIVNMGLLSFNISDKPLLIITICVSILYILFLMINICIIRSQTLKDYSLSKPKMDRMEMKDEKDAKISKNEEGIELSEKENLKSNASEHLSDSSDNNANDTVMENCMETVKDIKEAYEEERRGTFSYVLDKNASTAL